MGSNTLTLTSELNGCLKLYRRLGLSIIPLAYKSKKPLVNWKSYQKRQANAGQLELWFGNDNRPNIGLVCGKVSGNLVVLDFDSETLWTEWLGNWDEDKFGSINKGTPVVKTHRGYQVYLRTRQIVNTQRLNGIDIQGEGSYVVAPPSVHPTGKIYEFINPDVDTILMINDLSEVGVKRSSVQVSAKGIDRQALIQGVPEGQRDETCIRVAGYYKAKGLRYDETLILCGGWAKKCEPPFPEREVEKCVKSAYGYQQKEAQNQAEALAKAKEVALKWLKLEDTNIIDIVLATIVANKAEGDPVWLLLVGPPSTGKSEILRALFDCQGIHPLGGFTANTFASGFEKANVGLLKTLPKEITLVVKDFGTLLTLRHEDKAMILQQLREIYDGEYKKEYGNGKIVHWKGRIGLLGAVTTAIENYHGVIGELGNRYILYRCEPDEAHRHDIATLALNEEGAEKQMREEIAVAFKDVLNNAPQARTVTIPNEIKHQLACLADLTSRLRSPVSRNPYDKTVNYQPDIEGPARLAKAFAKLGKGLSAVRGKLQMTSEEYEAIKRVATDTVTKRRVMIIQHLVDKDWRRTKDIASELGMPQTTATLELEDLSMIGILDRKPDLKEGEKLAQTTPYKWRIKQDVSIFYSVIEDSTC
jgi:hypothetical protein